MGGEGCPLVDSGGQQQGEWAVYMRVCGGGGGTAHSKDVHVAPYAYYSLITTYMYMYSKLWV